LGLVMAHLAKPPFDNGFITFSATPQFVQLEAGMNLSQAINRMKTADWGMNTDFEAVFLKLLLPLAVTNKVKPEDMIKRLFVFSDMQFDASRMDRDAEWKTSHDNIETAYKAAGYEMPEIVYWDLAMGAQQLTSQVKADREGVAMMNGFSSSMLKVFMGDIFELDEKEEKEEQWEEVEKTGETKTVGVEKEKKEKEPITPLDIMKKALAKASYKDLVVVD